MRDPILRAAVLAPLVLVALLVCAEDSSASGERWDLMIVPGAHALSHHTTVADCQRELTRRARTLDRVPQGELPRPSLLCVSFGEATRPRELSQPLAVWPRWVLWRTSTSLSAGERVPEEVHSVHDSLDACDDALLRGVYSLHDVRTPAQSYRCLPALSRRLKRE